MLKFPLKMLAACAAFAFTAAPAAAEIYTYKMGNGDTLTIDSTSQSATWVGTKIDVSMTSADFGSFAGGEKPSFTATLSSLDGTRIINGVTYTDNPLNADTTHPQKLIMESTGKVNLWAWWGDPIKGGDYIKYVASYTPPPPTSVPAPGMLGLLAIGLGGVAFARRRRKTAKGTGGFQPAFA